jgi:hypothetical protein
MTAMTKGLSDEDEILDRHQTWRDTRCNGNEIARSTMTHNRKKSDETEQSFLLEGWCLLVGSCCGCCRRDSRCKLFVACNRRSCRRAARKYVAMIQSGRRTDWPLRLFGLEFSLSLKPIEVVSSYFFF